MDIKISVIVPVYNSEKYLKRCVDSILQQSYQNYEIILVNDGSVDKSGIICEEYKNKDARIRVIHQKNKGQAAARNIGIQIAKGEWIHFVDSDDCIHSQMLEKLLIAVERHNANLSMCGAIEQKEIYDEFFLPTSEKENYKFNIVDEKYLQQLITQDDKNYWTVWAKLVKKEIVKKYPFEEGKIYEDNAVVCKWLVEAKKVVSLEKQLYFYFINELGTSKCGFSEKQLDRLWALEEQIKFYGGIKYHNMQRLILSRYMLACASCLRASKDLKVRKKIRILFYKCLLRYFYKVSLNCREKMYVISSFFDMY